jgi:hypothetical protein
MHGWQRRRKEATHPAQQNATGLLPAGSVQQLVQGGYMRATASGAAAGLLLSLALTRLLRSLLYEVEPTDPVTIAAVIAALAAAAWLASFLPFRKAMRIGPMETMRSD